MKRRAFIQALIAGGAYAVAPIIPQLSGLPTILENTAAQEAVDRIAEAAGKTGVWNGNAIYSQWIDSHMALNILHHDAARKLPTGTAFDLIELLDDNGSRIEGYAWIQKERSHKGRHVVARCSGYDYLKIMQSEPFKVRLAPVVPQLHHYMSEGIAHILPRSKKA